MRLGSKQQVSARRMPKKRQVGSSYRSRVRLISALFVWLPHVPLLRTRPWRRADSPFARDASHKLVRRSYWLDMNDRSLVMVMTNGIGAHLTNDEKRAHLTDLKRDHLIEQVCVQEILPPEKK